MKKKERRIVSILSALTLSVSSFAAIPVTAENITEQETTTIAETVAETETTDAAETETPESTAQPAPSETPAPETEIPETSPEEQTTEAEIPEPETSVPESSEPETSVPEISEPETSESETDIPETSESETPEETEAEETSESETAEEETSKPESDVVCTKLTGTSYTDWIRKISQVKQEKSDKLIAEGLSTDDDYLTRIMVMTDGREISFDSYSPSAIVSGPDNNFFIQFETAQQASTAAQGLTATEGVIYAEVDSIMQLTDFEVEEPSGEYNLDELELDAVPTDYDLIGLHNISDQYSTDTINAYSLSWGVSHIGADTYSSYLKTQSTGSVTVAVLDTGVDYTHSFLSGRVIKGYDYVDNDYDPYDPSYYYKGGGHGTHVAGTIVDCTPGLNVKILAIRVLDKYGSGYMSDAASGIYEAVESGAKVINMSMGGGHSSSVDTAVNYAYRQGVVSVVAAGNDNENASGHCPAHISNAITVASLDSSETKSWFSNYGSVIDVSAPGSSIYSTLPGGRYGTMSGTSMATPHVAALCALLKLGSPSLTPYQIDSNLKAACRDLGTTGKDIYYGYGIPDLNYYVSYVGDCSLSLTQVKNGIQLNWSCSNAHGYQIAKNTGSGYQVIATISGNSKTYLDSSVSIGSEYLYQVRGWISLGNGSYIFGNWSSAKSLIMAFYNNPLINSATYTTKGVSLSWVGVNFAHGYEIFRNSGQGYQRIAIVWGTTPSYVDTTASPNLRYSYQIRAFARRAHDGVFLYSGFSPVAFSSLASFTIKTITPISGRKIFLEYTGCSYAVGYEVFRNSGSGWSRVAIIWGTTPRYTDTNLTAGRTYQYQIRAFRRLADGQYVYSSYTPMKSATAFN